MAVIGSAIAVLGHRPSELRHRQHHDVRHAIAEVAHERGDAAGEVVEPGRDLAVRCTFVDVVIPVARLRERDFEADVRLDQLRDLPERLAVRRAWIFGAVLRRVLFGSAVFSIFTASKASRPV